VRRATVTILLGVAATACTNEGDAPSTSGSETPSENSSEPTNGLDDRSAGGGAVDPDAPSAGPGDPAIRDPAIRDPAIRDPANRGPASRDSGTGGAVSVADDGTCANGDDTTSADGDKPACGDAVVSSGDDATTGDGVISTDGQTDDGEPSGDGSGQDTAAGGAGGVDADADGSGGETSVSVDDSVDVTVQLGRPRQEMAGFGINNMFAPEMTDAVADHLFDVDAGVGLTILRIVMDTSGDPLNGDRTWSDIIKAAERGVDTIIGTTLSPPAVAKTDNTVNDGGHLRPDYYEQWADTLAAFPAKVKQNTGIDLHAMSVQTEPDFASCGFAEPCDGNFPSTDHIAAELAEFVKVVGPKLHALSPPVRVIAPETRQWSRLWSNDTGCCSEPSGYPGPDPLDGRDYDYGHALYADELAWAQVDIMGTHQYVTQTAEPWPNDVPELRPVWVTEMAGAKWFPEAGPSTDIRNGIAVGGWIHDALTVGDASAWVWLWYRALASDVNEGLLLLDGVVAKRMWVLGNYSRFVRPGFTRVEITGVLPDGVKPTAFVGPDGTVVVVVINAASAGVELPITIAGGSVPGSMTPWVTSGSDDLVQKDAVAVSGATFDALLAAESVTTFVGR